MQDAILDWHKIYLSFSFRSGFIYLPLALGEGQGEGHFAAEENMTHLNTLIEDDRLDSYISETDVTLYAIRSIILYGIPAA